MEVPFSYVKKINDIENKIDSLDKKLDDILALLKTNHDTCVKMSSHIDFVENTYDTLKRPLFFFKHKVEQLIGKSEVKTIDIE